MSKRNRTNNDLQNTTEKTYDSATRTPRKTVVNLGCSAGLGVPVPALVMLLLRQHEQHLI